MPDTWSERTKPSGVDSHLLKEDTDFLLLETGDKIILSRGEEWSTRVKPS